MKKILLLIVSCLLLSGCGLKYETIIKSKNQVNEFISVSIDNTVALMYSETIENYFYDMVASYKQSYGIKNYDFKITEGRTESTISLEKSFSSVNDYFNDNVANLLFAKKSVENNENDLEIHYYEYISPFPNEEELLDPNYNVDDFSVIIRSNYKIMNCNADKINSVLGIYTWNFNSETNAKEIKLTVTDNINVFAFVYNMNTIIKTIVILLFVCLVGYLISKIIIKRMKKSNEI